MEGFIHDLRFGVRTLRKNLGFTLIAVVTLALGIGANVAMLGVTSSVLFRELPFRDADQVMALWRESPQLGKNHFSVPTFRDWHERNRAFRFLAAFREADHNLVDDFGDPDRVQSLQVSAEFLEALGVEPILGRGFLPEDDQLGAGRTALIGYELWQKRFGGDREVVDQTIRVDGEPYSVIGVLPPGLHRERISSTPLGDLWLPIGLFFDQPFAEDRAARFCRGIGRLRPGVTPEEARQDMDRIVRELRQLFPESYTNGLAGALLRNDMVANIRTTLMVLLAVVGFVLLIACSNLVNLMLTRTASQDQELATRVALGASRKRIVQQLLAETLLLTVFGSIAGLLVGSLCLRLLLGMTNGVIAIDEARVTGAIVTLVLLLTPFVSLLIGLLPALRATRGNRRTDIGARRGLLARAPLPRQGLRGGLVTLEVALALVLLIGTGLMLGTMVRLSSQHPGFETEHLLTMKLNLPQKSQEDRARWLLFFEEILEKIRALPGVEDVVVTNYPPMEPSSVTIVSPRDRAMPKTSEMDVAHYQFVSPGYFPTLGIPLLEGRGFDARDVDRSDGEDRDSEPVVVISRSLAERYWPDESPLDKWFAFEFTGSSEKPEAQWRRIVGVVEDIHQVRLREGPDLVAYAPYTQHTQYHEDLAIMTVLVRGQGDPTPLVQDVRAAILEVDPDQPVYDVRLMEDIVAGQLDQPKMRSSLFLSFSLLALVLALVGVYGVVSYTVASRTREIGIRMALGATRGQVLALFLRRGAVSVSIGLGVGLLAAALLSRLIAGFLFGFSPIDPGLYLGIALGLAAMTLLATLIPAWRGMKVEPVTALRYE